MKSPITGKQMKLIREADTLTFRKEAFNIVYHYYLCEDSGERFTDDRLDVLNTVQATNQYREKYGIPFPEEIREIREQYGVSAAKMSEILGLGVNAYRLYEAGEMPTVANGRLILSVREPQDFIKQIEASAHLLIKKEIEKYFDKAEKLISSKKKKRPIFGFVLDEVELSSPSPRATNGYRTLDIDKIAQVIAFFYERERFLFKTKLNKLLFYTDFLNYKNTGYSITGCSYRAIHYGPVPSEYERLLVRLQEEEYIKTNLTKNGDNYWELFESEIPFDPSIFSDEEIFSLEQVVRHFNRKNTQYIVEFSHKEAAWEDNYNNNMDIINYQLYAFQLSI